MTSKYRVIVLREGRDLSDETLFEIAGPAAIVGEIAPGAMLKALLGEVGDEVRSLADRVFDSAVAAGAAAEQQAAGPDGETAEQATKRKRRTKAQIAADTEAQGLGFRDATHRAEMERTQAPHPGGPDPVGVPAADTEGEAQAMRTVEPPPAPVVAPPYNPFAS